MKKLVRGNVFVAICEQSLERYLNKIVNSPENGTDPNRTDGDGNTIRYQYRTWKTIFQFSWQFDRINTHNLVICLFNTRNFKYNWQ